MPALWIMIAVTWPESAWAHGSGPPLQVLGWYGIILTNLALASFFYFRGWRLKGQREWRPLLFFAGGIGSVLAALLPPIDLLSEELLSIHMIQHMLLMMAAAPLFVFSYSDFFIRMGLARSSRRLLWQTTRHLVGSGINRVTRPLLIAGLYALILWIWHLPYLYESALGNRLIHNVQHLAFFISSYFFWKVLLRRVGRPALNPAAGVLYLFATSLHATALGVLMAMSPRIWYRFYAHTTGSHGLTALEDQQLAGYIMWMPAGLSYVLIAVWLTLRLLRDPGEPGPATRT
ncbi:MAG TPA: cytochrome c oxidase assembly protein [Oligoflexus sp.]|uniref:cytochrome c oxidase assembly protein n=1 Tax=Oligoflexus sp. TaxID=1971216 RepID=UPI002D52B417|nr:cytochrome c oxidase assembly protein [Oligoflexus sp.]HYX32469.1 cytochrome c oxidase assembly protein [Oligoflexus sp.]